MEEKREKELRMEKEEKGRNVNYSLYFK